MAQAYIVPDNHVAGEIGHGIYIVQGPEGLVVEAKELSFPAQGYTHFIGVHTDLAISVAPKEEANWLTLTHEPDGVVVTASVNATGADREATIEFKTLPPEGAEAQTAEVKVKQSKASSLNFVVSPSIVEVEATQQEVDLEVLTCDKAYTVFSGSSWCRINPTYGNQPVTAKLTVDENKESEPRKTQLTFRCGAKKLLVEVVQKGA